MKETWSIIMLVSGALLAGGMMPVALERAPAWRDADEDTFRRDFGNTIRRVDRLQPALLFITLISAPGFAVTAAGTARTLGSVAAGGLVAVLAGSLAGLVPLQQRLSNTATHMPAPDVAQLRSRWLVGHLIRTVVAVVVFVLLAVCAVV